ncbi:hypothetical protein ACJX0J_039879, partial [Zea mays]
DEVMAVVSANVAEVKDFRPISLSAFIKGRFIQDNFLLVLQNLGFGHAGRSLVSNALYFGDGYTRGFRCMQMIRAMFLLFLVFFGGDEKNLVIKPSWTGDGFQISETILVQIVPLATCLISICLSFTGSIILGKLPRKELILRLESSKIIHFVIKFYSSLWIGLVQYRLVHLVAQCVAYFAKYSWVDARLEMNLLHFTLLQTPIVKKKKFSIFDIILSYYLFGATIHHFLG